VQEKVGAKNALPAEEAAEVEFPFLWLYQSSHTCIVNVLSSSCGQIVQPFMEAVADDIEIAVENKDDGVQLPKTKRYLLVPLYC
jgi:hypothetical protein